MQSFSAEELAAERWRPIPEFPGYEVSDLGRVRSLDRAVTHVRNGREFQRQVRGRMLRPGTVKGGHQLVVLGRRKNRLVHALVLTSFVGPRPPKHDSCHRDGSPANNRLSNLRWDTRLGNIADTMAHGRGHRGDRHAFAKLRAEQIPAIRESLKSEPVLRVARRYGVSPGAIYSIKNGSNWKHVV